MALGVVELSVGDTQLNVREYIEALVLMEISLPSKLNCGGMRICESNTRIALSERSTSLEVMYVVGLIWSKNKLLSTMKLLSLV